MRPTLWASLLFAGLLALTPTTALAEGDVTTVDPSYQVVLPAPPRGYARLVTREAEWVYPEQSGELVRALERRRADHMREIEVELGVPVFDRVIVRVARNPDEMRALAPVGLPPPPYAEGVAYPELGIILLCLTGPNPAAPVNVPSVFVHELSHVALHRAVNRNRVPRWFSEGVAIYQARERRLERAQTLFDAYGSGALHGLGTLDRAFGSPDDRVVGVAYAQSASMVTFMLGDNRGRAKLQRLIREMGTGVPFEEAFDRAYYMPLDDMHKAWRKNLGERYSILPYVFGGTTIWVVCTIAIAFGYARKRREAKARLARMGEEEAALDALDRLLAAKLAEAEAAAADAEALSRELESESTPSRDSDPPEDGSNEGIPVVSHEGERHTLH